MHADPTERQKNLGQHCADDASRGDLDLHGQRLIGAFDTAPIERNRCGSLCLRLLSRIPSPSRTLALAHSRCIVACGSVPRQADFLYIAGACHRNEQALLERALACYSRVLALPESTGNCNARRPPKHT